VLIVEDHEGLRESLKNWLITIFEDFRVFPASSGEEAVGMAAELKPDIIIMDVFLPGMSGIEALRLIRSDMPETRVIMLSIYEDQAYHTNAMAAGACAYITKRKMGTELVPLIRRLLPGPRPPET
jgi:DNA-binding NarL/FixJ family response regulator